jgi:hypothetical protein
VKEFSLTMTKIAMVRWTTRNLLLFSVEVKAPEDLLLNRKEAIKLVLNQEKLNR